MNRRRTTPAGTAVLVIVLISGVFWLHHQPATDSATPGSAPAQSRTPAPSDDGQYVVEMTAAVTVFYVGGPSDDPIVFSKHVWVGGRSSELSAVRESALASKNHHGAHTYWPTAVKIREVSWDLESNASTDAVKIVLSSSADRPDDVTDAQAKAQVEAMIKTAQEAFGSSSNYDGQVVRNPPPDVHFFVGDEPQSTVLGVRVPG